MTSHTIEILFNEYIRLELKLSNNSTQCLESKEFLEIVREKKKLFKQFVKLPKYTEH